MFEDIDCRMFKRTVNHLNGYDPLEMLIWYMIFEKDECVNVLMSRL